jgi:hypothetical protein
MDCPLCKGSSKELKEIYVGEDGNDGIDQFRRCKRCFAKFMVSYSRGTSNVSTELMGPHRYLGWMVALLLVGSVCFIYSSL